MATAVSRIDYSQITKPTIQYELYNPSDEPAEFMFDGEIFVVPPAFVKWHGRDPFTGKFIEYPVPGVLPLHDRPGRFTALQVLQYSVGEDGISGAVGKRGVRPLFGNKEKDDIVRREAKEVWEAKKFIDCTAIVRAHEAAVKAAMEAGTERPRVTPLVLAAQDWLEAHDDQSAMPYTCETCNRGFNEERRLLNHQAKLHSDKEAQRKLGLGLPDAPPPPEPNHTPPSQRTGKA